MINVFVKQQTIKITAPAIASETIDYLTAQFFFQTSEWEGAIKTAVFEKEGENPYAIILENDAITADKHLNLSAGTWKVGVVGVKDGVRITTFCAGIEVGESCKVNGESFPDVPPTLAEQILLKATNAEKIAQSVRDDADAGKFDGLSAYELAVKNGFKGTEAEWIESNKYYHSEEFTKLSEQVKSDANKSAVALENCENAVTQAHGFAEASEKFAGNAKTSENNSAQALEDLLGAIGTSVPELVGGKIPLSQIPATAIGESFEVASKEELTKLTAQRYDVGYTTDLKDGERFTNRQWQLLGDGDPTNLDNWLAFGASYAVRAGFAEIAGNANDSERINGMRFVTMTYSQFENAVKDENTLYAVDMGV